MIRIEHLHKTYPLERKAKTNDTPVAALSDINLHIKKGEIFGIIGRSGAGKSTLIRTLNMLERPSSGQVLIEGEDITALDNSGLHRLRQRIGMIFQHFNLLSAKTVAANIDWPLKITGKYTQQERAARVTELLNLVGLSEQRDKYPAQLSGGQKQRVGIARALANTPHLLLCDEATSALDPETTQAILRLLLDINRKLGLTIVLITHEMQVIRNICDRVAVIEAGHIVETGDVAEVFLHPQHAVTRSMVAESTPFSAETSLLPSTVPGASQLRGLLVRLTYVGDITYQPILSSIAAATPALITILQGTIARIKDTPYGQLLVEIHGETADVAQVFTTLDQHNIRHEVLA
ncbi:methionine ABC transporter ATP-binding protein [Glaciimonas soli]|uniref:Cell division ATP-binding protein FtsE n=1 Tax=Glaciimonas soli TaxID=2590999 RepID=A0A843YQV8_9BURK|nr:methionine ABC transporter ATP-binding protein [Glaciimonas soli]MQQ99770.1 ATP-binding cassette domain-containing protein [Glaciimonas soli]